MLVGKLNNGPQRYLGHHSEPVNIVLYDKVDFADVIKLRIPAWGIILDYLVDPKCNHRCPYEGTVERSDTGEEAV